MKKCKRTLATLSLLTLSLLAMAQAQAQAPVVNASKVQPLVPVLPTTRLPQVLAPGQVALDNAIAAIIRPERMTWQRAPNGNEIAVVLGHPAKPGPYALLLRWGPGIMSRPHWHPTDRYHIIISGTLWMGTGTHYDPATVVPAPAGSFVTHFARGIHYAGSKDEPVVVMIFGEGPETPTNVEYTTPSGATSAK